ncbi:hypothetical protein [Massilia glaciei]|uniref:hypothetical protein n=1 Tax=Massilia glaciei TaxID=1524097 RepID=UPI0011B2382F|nr:hypothetical protein [Massilia glaciei]
MRVFGLAHGELEYLREVLGVHLGARLYRRHDQFQRFCPTADAAQAQQGGQGAGAGIEEFKWHRLL